MKLRRCYLPALAASIGAGTLTAAVFNARWMTQVLRYRSSGTRADRPTGGVDAEERDRPDGFSSCLLWMDDNFRLPEWLAYHYYVMNLRYVVIFPDPRSKTSPKPVLNQWRDLIHIVEWSDPSNFTDQTYDFPDLETGRNESSTEVNAIIIQQRSETFFRRQIDFYQACAMHMKSQNRTWTSFHDNDEFLVVVSRTIRGNRSGTDDAPTQEEEGAGMALKVVERYARRAADREDAAANGTRAGEERALATFESFEDWDLWFSAVPCVVLPRVLMGSVPSADADVERGVPPFLDAHRFDTLRWRVQGTRRDEKDGPGKAIVDVTRLPNNAVELVRDDAGIHRPFGNLCTHAWAPGNGLPLAFHHYIGSWEEFSYRDDVRKGVDRSRLKWEEQSAMQYGGYNDDARDWIKGFVSVVGEDVAADLLRDAGLPRNYTKPTNDTADWVFIGTNRGWT
jgi:hypothetical protein